MKLTINDRHLSLFCLLSILFCSSLQAALSFNKIIELDDINDYSYFDGRTISQNPMVLNNKVIFKDKMNRLWFNDGSTNGSILAQNSNAPIRVYRNLIKVGSFVLFLNSADNNTLYKTNG